MAGVDAKVEDLDQEMNGVCLQARLVTHKPLARERKLQRPWNNNSAVADDKIKMARRRTNSSLARATSRDPTTSATADCTTRVRRPSRRRINKPEQPKTRRSAPRWCLQELQPPHSWTTVIARIVATGRRRQSADPSLRAPPAAEQHGGRGWPEQTMARKWRCGRQQRSTASPVRGEEPRPSRDEPSILLPYGRVHRLLGYL